MLDSLDVLALTYGSGLAEAVKAYEEDTGLVFSRSRLRAYGVEL